MLKLRKTTPIHAAFVFLLLPLILSFTACDRDRSQADFISPADLAEKPAVDASDPGRSTPAGTNPTDSNLAPQASQTVSPELRRRTVRSTPRITSGETISSGLVVGADHRGLWILTVAHGLPSTVDLSPSDSIQVELFELGRLHPDRSESVEIFDRNDEIDLALLLVQMGDFRLHPDRIAISKQPKIGPPVWSVGCDTDEPRIFAEKIRKSGVFRIPDRIKPIMMFSTSEGTMPGRSGGPLVNSDGELLGICQGTVSEAGFFVHFSVVIRYLVDSDLGSLLPFGLTR